MISFIFQLFLMFRSALKSWQSLLLDVRDSKRLPKPLKASWYVLGLMWELWHCCVYLSFTRIKIHFPDGSSARDAHVQKLLSISEILAFPFSHKESFLLFDKFFILVMTSRSYTNFYSQTIEFQWALVQFVQTGKVWERGE